MNKFPFVWFDSDNLRNFLSPDVGDKDGLGSTLDFKSRSEFKAQS